VAQALVRIAYETLGLQTYYTSGPKETRAWTILKGMTAPEVIETRVSWRWNKFIWIITESVNHSLFYSYTRDASLVEGRTVA